VKDVDFDTARFIVCKQSGLDIGEQHLEMGDEIPKGALNAIALRQIYETPLRLIETVEYAAQDPELAAACTRKNVSLDPESEQDPEPEPDATQMCSECGVFYPDLSKHSAKQCRRNQRRK
jgi:hypothetical protein